MLHKEIITIEQKNVNDLLDADRKLAFFLTEELRDFMGKLIDIRKNNESSLLINDKRCISALIELLREIINYKMFYFENSFRTHSQALQKISGAAFIQFDETKRRFKLDEYLDEFYSKFFKGFNISNYIYKNIYNMETFSYLDIFSQYPNTYRLMIKTVEDLIKLSEQNSAKKNEILKPLLNEFEEFARLIQSEEDCQKLQKHFPENTKSIKEMRAHLRLKGLEKLHIKCWVSFFKKSGKIIPAPVSIRIIDFLDNRENTFVPAKHSEIKIPTLLKS